MKKFLILLLYSACIYCQSSGLSLYGVGGRIDVVDPISIGLGNSNYFSGNSKNINNDSPSSVWRSALTRLSIHSGVDYSNISDLSNQYRHGLTSFSIYFPVGNKKVFGFGLQPIFRINDMRIVDETYSFIGSDNSLTKNPIAYKNNYSINGGISQLFLVYSSKLNSNFSYGIKYSLLFGNQVISDQLYTYDVVVDTSISTSLLIDEIVNDTTSLFFLANNSSLTEIDRYKKFNGSSISFEGRYGYHNHEFVFSTLVHNKNKIKITTEQNINNFISSTISQITSGNFTSNFGFGYKNKMSNNRGIVFESHHKSPFNIPQSVSIFNVLPPKESSYHLGFFYRHLNPKIGFWNSFIYRLGYYYKSKLFSDNNSFSDFGFTLGFGIEYINSSQSIDIAFRFGNKESLSFIDRDEKYISLHIGLTTGEKWFMKRRRK